jgi:hypothetical protein|tara:strand:- start:1283 stop:2029 length:747 start_codon:yes stop_codon:yes gene_type:complete
MGLPRIAVPEYSLKLPSNGKEIKYRPFLVKEEKILLIAMESEDDDQIAAASKTVINNCIYADIDVNDLPIFDVEYIFLQLRARAKGELIELKYNCPKCENEIPMSFNIDEINVTKEEGHDPKIQLTDELGVVMKYPNMALQTEIEKNKNENQVEQLFRTIMICIDYIYDAEKMYSNKDHTKEELTEFLESLTDPQFQKISKFFETMPRLKHKINLECRNKVKGEGKKKDKACGYTEEMALEGLQSFFD